MPLPFSHVCDLLEQCNRLCAAGQKHQPAVVNWFHRHRAIIDAHDTNVAALLSTLLPEKRTDRVYCIKAPTLEKIVGRALMLGSSRMQELALHKVPGSGVDLADCVERILLATPNPEQPPHNAVTVDYIDTVLHSLASRIRWSSPKVRNDQTAISHESRGELETLYLRLSAVEAKWFTRLILKNYEPLIFHSGAIYGLCDKALPSALKILDDFVAAIEAVQHANTRLLPTSSRGNIPGNRILALVKPKHGFKIGRQPWLKARSIKHCLDMGQGRMSVEKKIDGEYCQIHVDFSNSQQPLQIFSKSGKDSTEDRKGLHSAILHSIRRGPSGMSVEQKCILEGELVVYSDRDMKIRPFHTIRKYVSRRGHFLNTDQDSQPKSYEHLMIVYFDILSLDNSSLLSARHSERRKHLERIIQPIPGRSEVVFRQEIDFGHRLAASHLRKAFAAVIMQRGEGLVVKPDEAYFDFSPGQRRFASSCIKLKKEYIGNFGEVGDFAVVGAGFDAARAKSYGIPGLKWTHFYLGCLNNKEEVARWGAKPDFTVVSIVELNDTQLRSFVVHCQTDAVPQRDNKATTIKLAAGLIRQPPLSVAFTQPPVVDVRCFSFDKEGNTGFWTPRFPGVSKIHFDRDFVDTVTFDDLQAIAQEATSTPELEDSQENLQWIARLERADPRGIAVDATSQLTASSLATPSPRRRTQSFSEGGSPVSPRRSASQPLVGKANAFFDGSPIPLKLPRSAAQQITPPTSSAAQESSSTSKKTQGGQKRRHVSDLRDSPTKRRGSATLTHEPSKGGPGRAGSSPMLPERIPLGNIKGNGSQQSPVSATRRSNHKVLIDLTLSPTSSQVSESAVMSAVIDENDCLQTTAITIPDAEDAIQSREAPQKDTHMLTEDAPLNVCKFAGSLCQFAETQLALAPHLQKSTHIIRRLREHGIIAPQLDFGEFSAAVKSMVKSRPGTAILLVDSVGASRQTRVVLDDLEQSLDTDTTMERSWVHVFDWRVLDTISKLEDQSVRPAGFDGFSGPWRRWHVGVL